LRLRGLDVFEVGDDGKEVLRERLSLLDRVAEVKHRSATLSLVVFSDFRSQSIEALIALIKRHPRPDLVLYGGDDLKRFRPGERNLFEEIASLARYGLCAVAGNDDRNGNAHLTGRNVYAVHSEALVVGPFAVVGVEGAPRFPNGFGDGMNRGYLLYPEPLIGRQIAVCAKRFPEKKLIVVSHAPPFGVLDFAVRFGAKHIGSRPLRMFLDIGGVALLCVCGHVHRCGGQTQDVGGCLVVNAASHDGPGDPARVARIEVARGKVKAVNWLSR
jgi:Icc-related predicted phosphoesterase